MRAVDARRGAGFREESVDHLRQPRQVGREDLHRDGLVEQRVMRPEHDRHPTHAKLAVDAVLVRDEVADARKELG